MSVIVPLSEIYPDKEFNCRGAIVPNDVIELAQSIQDKGLIAPIVVQPYDQIPGKKYRIICGYRRYTACVVLDLKEIEVIIRENLTEMDALTLNLMENLNRKELNILQEAQSISRYKKFGLGEHAVADIVKKSRGWVQTRFMLLDLPPEVQEAAASGVFTNQNVRDIYSGKSTEERYELAKKIKEAKQVSNQKVDRQVVAKYDKNLKRLRSRKEICFVSDQIYTAFGPNLATRVLAWAAGEISDGDMYASVETEGLKTGVQFFPPVDGSILS